MTMSDFLEVERLTVGYGSTPVLSGVSLSVSEGELVALLGSSGCGKTTLLRTIAGFATPSSGTMRVAGRDITHLPPDRRDMAMVFQSYALWPHMTARQNIGYGLKVRRVPPREARAKVDEVLAMLGLEALGDRSVTALSGGQRQRVALGRALAVDPRILLLDEPLSNLDARIRHAVRHEIRALQSRLGITAIHVTHDREEAMVMADRIVILNDGRIEQQGRPEEVYNHPHSPFVARFMGAENVLELRAHFRAGNIEVLPGPHNAPAVFARAEADRAPAGADGGETAVSAFFRGEAAILSEADEHQTDEASPANELVLTGRVTQVSYPGGIWRHTVAVAGQEIQLDSPHRHAPSTMVQARLPDAAVFIFPHGGQDQEGRPHRPDTTRQPAERVAAAG